MIAPRKKFKQDAIEVKDDTMVVDGKAIKIFGERDPENLPWGSIGVDVVIESTGFFTDKKTGLANILKPVLKKLLFLLLPKVMLKNDRIQCQRKYS